MEGGGNKSTAKSKNNGKEKQMIRGKRRCKRCGELGHVESSYKCKLNGTKKKRKRKARWNTTKYGKAAEPEPSTPTRPNVEIIMQQSPVPVTRCQFAMLMEQGVQTSSQPAPASKKTCARKLPTKSSSQPTPPSDVSIKESLYKEADTQENEAYLNVLSCVLMYPSCTNVLMHACVVFL